MITSIAPFLGGGAFFLSSTFFAGAPLPPAGTYISATGGGSSSPSFQINVQSLNMSETISSSTNVSGLIHFHFILR